jgi:ribonuclease J
MPARPPEIISRGFMDDEEMSELFHKVSASVMESLDHVPTYPIDWGSTRTLVEDTVRKLLLEETGRRPIIMPVALEV